MTPWGRLTLISDQTMNTNISSSVLYYTPFETDEWPELDMSVSSNNGLFDVYLLNTNLIDASKLSLALQPFNSTKREEGGLWYAPNEPDLYLGSVNIQNGIINWQPNLPAMPYGSNPMLGVFNAYNRLPVIARCLNSNSEWLYNESGLRFADNSNLMRISWVDGLGDVMSKGQYTCSIAGVNTSPAAATVGVGLNMQEYPLNWGGLLPQGAMNNQATGMQIMGSDICYGKQGLNNWQAIEQSTNVPVTFFGNNFCELRAELSL